MPIWLDYSAAVCSIIGLAISLMVLYQTKAIRTSFMRRARLPEISSDMSKLTATFLKVIKSWPEDKQLGTAQVHNAIDLLSSAKRKVPSTYKKRISQASSKLCTRKLFRVEPLDMTTKDQAWIIYYELSSICIVLEQLVKDTKWD